MTMAQQPSIWARDDEGGAVLVEVAIVMTIMLVFVLGAIEFLLVFYQWNTAAKAVQIGARIAAVSDPVASGLNGLSKSVVGPTVPPGASMPNFAITCDGSTARCVCDGSGFCPSDLAYNAPAMNTIIFSAPARLVPMPPHSMMLECATYLPELRRRMWSSPMPKPGSVLPAGRADQYQPSRFLSRTYLCNSCFCGALRASMIYIPPLATSITAEDLSSGAPTF
jgi:hypothetical protein